MYILSKFRWSWLLTLCTLLIIVIFNITAHFFEVSYDKFKYPPEDEAALGSPGRLSGETIQHIIFTAANSICIEQLKESHAKPYLMFVIKSALKNVEHRAAIRQTWGGGHNNTNQPKTICTLFVLGATPDAALTQQVKEEAATHKDIVQADFIDSYYNNTIKTLMGLRWSVEVCGKNCDYVMFVDDDYYVSPRNVFRFIDQHSSLSHLYAGFVLQTAPHRHMFSKWYITLREYPFELWPPYITAGAFLLSRRALHALYECSLRMPLFRFDDIFLGIVSLYANVTLIHSSKFYFERPAYSGPASYRDVIAAHGFDDPDELQHIWQEMASARYYT